MDKELIFEARELFREWLENYGQTSDSVWLIFGKTGMLKTLSAHEALEEALCYGWIDGQMQSIDAHIYKKYFARRRAASKWSEKNKKLVEELIRDKKMTRHGLQAIERARKNGEWDKTHNSNISENQKSEFESKIRPHLQANKNYCSMPPSTQKQFIGFYFDAKREETRQKRLEKIISLLEQNKRLM
jgi:uncharacterized protein YdeI (YjbR/CyaY-like superfamily)